MALHKHTERIKLRQTLTLVLFVYNGIASTISTGAVSSVAETHYEENATNDKIVNQSTDWTRTTEEIFHLTKSSANQGGAVDQNTGGAVDNTAHASSLDHATTNLNASETSALTEQSRNVFLLNVSACTSRDERKIIATNGTVRIIKPFHRPGMHCDMVIHVPKDHSLNASFLQLPKNETTHDVIHISLFESASLNIRIIEGEDLSNHRVNATFNSSTYFTYISSPGNHTVTAIMVHFNIHKNPPPKALKVVCLSNTTYSVTSPNFDGKALTYQNDVSAAYLIRLPVDHVLIVVFYHFDLGPQCSDRLVFNDTTNATVGMTLCAKKYYLLSLRFYNSIRLHFITDSYSTYTGFKFIFSVLPIANEPEQLDSGLYDCSVPYFDSFRELFSCNLHLECEGGEDEEGCGYNHTGCGIGAVNAGEKCYKLIWPNSTVSWRDAHLSCEKNNQNLATMATAGEWNRFKEIMAFRTKFINLPVLVGLSLMDSDSTSLSLYNNVWTWADRRSAFYADLVTLFAVTKPRCASYYEYATFDSNDILKYNTRLKDYPCGDATEALYICEFYKSDTSNELNVTVDFPSLEMIDTLSVNSLAACPSGELTHDFLLCDKEGPCNGEEYGQSCSVADVEVQMFVCARGMQKIPFTLVCDHRNQCNDYSDEDFCRFPPHCKEMEFRCRNQQCVDNSVKCDGMFHCTDGSDENCVEAISRFPPLTEPPFKVDMADKGGHVRRHMNDFDVCPATHFQCHEEICLPVYLRCNGFDDCPGREDEDDCDSYTCPGFYHCRGSRVCLHPDQVCDKHFQCPQYDDELLCDLDCPDVCRCQGLSFKCSANFAAGDFRFLRYLDASGSGMSLVDVKDNRYLIRLHLSFCNLQTLPEMTLQNLRYLDLSHNSLHTISMFFFKELVNLLTLDLSNNPIHSLTNPWSGEQYKYSRLTSLDLSHTDIDSYDSDILSCCKMLQSLNMSSSSLREISADGFTSTPKLTTVDMSNSPLVVYPLDLLQKLKDLHYVSVDSYKLCCEATLPERFDEKNCHAEPEGLASCHDLLQSNLYRAFLWLFASFSLVGNVGSFLTRLYMRRGGAGSGEVGSFSVLVTNLSVADFFMGVYLAMIGVADQFYRGEYLWKDDEWKNSSACHFAGFLSLMSSEVSAFIICLITCDRFLVLRFPFSQFHFNRKSALVASAVAWVIGIVLAAVPLMPMTSHWEFYSQSGICVPLPFSGRNSFLGYSYSLGIMICLNFFLFLLIAVGQVIIYISVRTNSMTDYKQRSRDATIARRLTTIVVSDFLCWFPIGLIGLQAYSGLTIPPVANVFVAIMVLPFNSALNPFLYTFNIIAEKRRKARETRLLKQLETRYLTELSKAEDKAKPRKSLSKETAMSQLDDWLTKKLLTPEDVASRLAPFVTCEYTPHSDTTSGTY